MTTCTKRFGDLSFAHRQWQHEGHCKQFHAHGAWAFDIEFYAAVLDANNFVIDFGDLKDLKKALDQRFDHTLVLNIDDPELDFFKVMAQKGLCQLRVVPSASAEGLAKYVFALADEIVKNQTNGRVRARSVVCWEDSKNSAKYQEAVF